MYMSCRFTQFTFHKVDAQAGTGLPGAVFRLLCPGSYDFTAISDAQGFVRFCVPFPGCFVLIEKTPPEGYVPTAKRFCVMADRCGNVFVNCKLACDFKISNVRQAVSGMLNVLKNDQAGNPLAGAVFTIASGGVPVQSRTSDASGMMRFDGIVPGTYTLMETQAPNGFAPNTEVYAVEVLSSGMVLVNGVPTSLLTVADTPVTITISGTKTWNDFNNILGLRPASFTVTLLRNGAPFQAQQVPSTAREFTFPDVLKYAPDGMEFVYTISEAPIPAYFFTIDGFDITNTIYS